MRILLAAAGGLPMLLLTAFLCFLPMPQLGITEELRYQAFGAADDFLREHPQRTLGWGVVYFFADGGGGSVRRLADSRLDATAGGQGMGGIAEVRARLAID